MEPSPDKARQPQDAQQVASTQRKPFPKPQHACHCGKAFIRKEHLRRHQLTHVQSAHVCPICDRSFTRNDILQRHIPLHGPGSRLKRACDACRAAKKSCDRDDVAGAVCSLCLARNRGCTFTQAGAGHLQDDGTQGHLQDDAIQSRQEAEARDAASVNRSDPSVMDVDTVDNTLEEAGESEVAITALRFIYDTLSSPATDLTVGEFRHMPVQASSMIWFESCCRAYFKHLHHRWPVVSHIQYEVAKEPLILSITVIISGCLLQEVNQDAKDLALQIHEALVGKCFADIASLKFTSKGAWEFATFQAMLLNVVFALLFGTKPLLDRACLMYELFISTLRKIEFFSSEAMAYQEANHFTATFTPFRLITYEKWKRLVANTCKLDTYLSILLRRPPLLHAAELDTDLPVRFCLWNVTTLGMLFERHPEEPADRKNYKISDLLGTDGVVAPSDPLVEDIELGLCGTLLQVWELSQRRLVARYDLLADTAAITKLSSQLEALKARLNTISASMGLREPDAQGSARDFLYRAYMGRESRDDADWEEVASSRIVSLVADAALLHYLLAGILLGQQLQSVDQCVSSDINPFVKGMWEKLFAAVGDRFDSELNGSPTMEFRI